MKKILLPVVLAMLGTSLFTSCSNDESLAVDKVNNYKENFEKVFGQVSSAQNFNTLKTVTIESSVANAQGNYTLRVYDGVPTRKGASLVGKFENLNASGTSTVKVDVSKSAKNIYCVADNGEVRTALSAQVASKTHVMAKFDTAEGAPTNEPANNDEQLSTVTIAFEDLGSTDDFDFNDAVIKVEYATGTGVANITLMAVGAVLPLKLYYAAGREAVPLFNGQELHAAMSVQNVSTMINTNWKTAQGVEGVDNVPFATCEIAVPQDFTIGEDGAPFILEVNGVEGQRQITASTEYGAIPQVLVTGKYYDEEARTSYFWRWPKERVRLNLAFPTVSDWMADPTNLTFLAAGAESNLYDGYDPTVVDEQQQPTTGTPEGLEAVNLGLPSGTFWANMNVGATAPEEYGAYFAWGETEEKDVYNWSTYIHCDGSAYTCHELGSDIAGTQYDVAHVRWGDIWHMPSLDQIMELVNHTTRSWTTLNGVEGIKFTGINGNSIFLPAAGSRWDSSLENAVEYCYWWSSNQDLDISFGAHVYIILGNYVGDYLTNRAEGYPVRPVYSAPGVHNLALSKAEVIIDSGKNSEVNITSGSGNYTVMSSNTSLATAKIDGANVIISAVAEGTATITVTDSSSGQTWTITVTVVKSEVLEAVDLGLPSGTKWANMNVGAEYSWDYGGYYAWGEIEEKDHYDWDNYIHCDGPWEAFHDLGSDIAGTQYDVAHVKWGGDWQMPTAEQFNELENNCTYEWTTINGVDGGKFTGPNGNSIFLPGDYYLQSMQHSDLALTDCCGITFFEYPWGEYQAILWWEDWRFNGHRVRPISRK